MATAARPAVAGGKKSDAGKLGSRMADPARRMASTRRVCVLLHTSSFSPPGCSSPRTRPHLRDPLTRLRTTQTGRPSRRPRPAAHAPAHPALARPCQVRDACSPLPGRPAATSRGRQWCAPAPRCSFARTRSALRSRDGWRRFRARKKCSCRVSALYHPCPRCLERTAKVGRLSPIRAALLSVRRARICSSGRLGPFRKHSWSPLCQH
ncbi:hypothetical protein DMC30DRAFT_91398 [Rhodotorula diobovata]|nr:hypothetical protein DMC30DRAFT_91398 [Rhodotorula diobovata]